MAGSYFAEESRLTLLIERFSGHQRQKVLRQYIASASASRCPLRLINGYLNMRTLRSEPHQVRAAKHQSVFGRCGRFSCNKKSKTTLPGGSDEIWKQTFGRWQSHLVGAREEGSRRKRAKCKESSFVLIWVSDDFINGIRRFLHLVRWGRPPTMAQNSLYSRSR